MQTKCHAERIILTANHKNVSLCLTTFSKSEDITEFISQEGCKQKIFNTTLP